jgi:hypothetical protein
VKGTLVISGSSGTGNQVTFTRTGTSGTWGGIVLENGGSGDITYADFSHCGTALRISDGGTLSVDHCTFSNVSIGAEILADADGDEEPARSITNSAFSNFSSTGIVADNFSNLVIDGVTITDASGATGIVCITAHPTILRTRVEGVKYGMLFHTNSSPVLEDGSFGGNNVIKYNDVGVECSDGSPANLGLATAPGNDFGGQNSILDNGLDAYIVDESIVSAENDFWNHDGEPPSNIYVDYSSVLDFNPWLKEDPNARSSHLGRRARSHHLSVETILG